MRRVPRLIMNSAPRLKAAATAPPLSAPVRPPSSPLIKPPSFRSLVSSDLVAALGSIDVHEPNALQVRGLPRLLRGEDTLCCAQTGSGKTLLFLLPILRQLFGPPPSREPRVVLSHKFDESRPKKAKRGFIAKTVLPSAPDALVLVHSRELALQIAHVARSLAAGLPGRLDDRVCCLTNGAAYTPQRAQLRGGGVRLVVATPARLLYHLGEDNMSLHGVRVLAADEADALLCQRGGPLAGEARQVLEAAQRATRHEKGRLQTILTSATVSQEDEAELRALVPRARRLSHVGVLAPTLERRFVAVRSNLTHRKDDELLRLLRRTEAAPPRDGDGGAAAATMLFCTGARRARHVVELLRHEAPWLRVAALHGECVREERDAALAAFHDGDAQLLVCTDLAARGLDFPHVRHVVMYDMPKDVTSFIHRAGRTARRGERGLLSCLYTPHEYDLHREIIEGEGRQGELTPLQLSGGRSSEQRAAAAAATAAASDGEEEAAAAARLIWDAAPWEFSEGGEAEVEVEPAVAVAAAETGVRVAQHETGSESVEEAAPLGDAYRVVDGAQSGDNA